MKKWSRIISVKAATIIAFVSCLSATGMASEDGPGKGVTVQPAYGSDIGALFQLEIVNLGLRDLGYNLKKNMEATAGAVYATLANGDTDYYTQAWVPLQQHYFERGGGADSYTHVGDLVKRASQGYQIDKKTADDYNITNIGQLKDPEIAKLFDSDGNGRAELIGCPPGWGCERAIEHQMDVYDLNAAVEVKSGDFTALRADVVSRYRDGESVLYYTFLPNWMNQLMKIGEDAVWLEVPFTSLPPEIEATGDMNTISEDGKNLGMGINVIKVLANNEFLRDNPVAKRWFELVTIPVEDINHQNTLIYYGEKTTADIERHARDWREANRAQWDVWIEEAAKAR